MSNAEYPTSTLRISNIVSYVLLIAVNVASNSGLLGPSNADISQKYSTPLTPEGWAFSIWGLIFTLEGLGVIFAALPYGYNTDGWKERTVNAIGYTWQVCWLCECCWQLLFLRQTTAGMVACLFALFGAFGAMLYGLSKLYRLVHTHGSLPSSILYVAFFLPTSINAAWLSVASGLGVLIVPVSYGSTAYVEAEAVILAMVVTAAGVLTLLREKDTAYGLTLLWSLVAVYEKHKNLQAMKYVSLAGILVLCVTASLSVLQRRRQAPYSPLGRSSVEEPLQA